MNMQNTCKCCRHMWRSAIYTCISKQPETYCGAPYTTNVDNHYSRTGNTSVPTILPKQTTVLPNRKDYVQRKLRFQTDRRENRNFHFLIAERCKAYP